MSVVRGLAASWTKRTERRSAMVDLVQSPIKANCKVRASEASIPFEVNPDMLQPARCESNASPVARLDAPSNPAVLLRFEVGTLEVNVSSRSIGEARETTHDCREVVAVLLSQNTTKHRPVRLRKNIHQAVHLFVKHRVDWRLLARLPRRSVSEGRPRVDRVGRRMARRRRSRGELR